MPHIHEKIDFAADTFIVYKDRVLLRKHDKYKIWLPPGGHVELDEDPNQAAIREVKEEVGLDIELAPSFPVDEFPIQTFSDSGELIPPRFVNRHRINDTHEHVSFVYFAKATTGHIHQGKTEISDAVRWFTRQELDDPALGVSDRIKCYAKTALKELS